MGHTTGVLFETNAVAPTRADGHDQQPPKGWRLSLGQLGRAFWPWPLAILGPPWGVFKHIPW